MVIALDEMLKPSQIKRLPTGLQIEWSDGMSGSIDALVLRRNCPCAACREAQGDTSHQRPLGGGAKSKPSSLKIVSSTIAEETRLDRIWAIGNYALGLAWGDGHQTGIYTFALLRKLQGEENQNEQEHR